ncbi:glycosyltransferase [Paraclostridium bifermentans]|uniref:glycosyltransferase n=1 Tax=Paraclostridium bifermentans TaxID=1490 RepID=UPI00290AFE5F|nr:glycosyltransferase [Paraclostridium bifermentans]MDU3335635.1 glycosyltransferase [Paraclostridium bifermentans]
MNILHCICSLNTGGAEKLLIDIANNMKLSKSDNLHICITNSSYEDELLKQINKDIKIDFLNRKEGSKSIKYILIFIDLIKKNKIDIIHCHNRGSYKFALLAKILTGFKVKIVYTIHDTNVYNKVSRKNAFIDKFLVDKFIAISDSVNKDILSRNINKEKVELIYNGIDISKFNKGKAKNFNENNIVIGCVSRLVPEKKGQDILIKAVNIIKEKYPYVKCIFAGAVLEVNGKEDLNTLKLLEKQVESLNLKDNIEFIGNVKNVSEFLEGIDIFVLPSRVEGFGLVILEAMASRKPVIASDIDGPREIIGEEYGLLFEKENYEELSEKIIYAIENYTSFNTEKNYKYVEKNFSIDSICNLYYSLYSSILY